MIDCSLHAYCPDCGRDIPLPANQMRLDQLAQHDRLELIEPGSGHRFCQCCHVCTCGLWLFEMRG